MFYFKIQECSFNKHEEILIQDTNTIKCKNTFIQTRFRVIKYTQNTKARNFKNPISDHLLITARFKYLGPTRANFKYVRNEPYNTARTRHAKMLAPAYTAVSFVCNNG